MIKFRLIMFPVAGFLAASLAWAADKAPEEGFVPLFNGKDLSGWTIPDGDDGHWKVVDGAIDYDADSRAKGDRALWSEREYGDFVLLVDWRLKEAPFINKNIPYILPDGTHAKDIHGKELRISLPDADSGVYLRGDGRFQTNIWCWPIGSGELYGVRTDPKTTPELRAAATPRTQADKPVGEWNHFEITVKGKTVRVALNGKTVISGATIPDLPDRGRLAFQHHGSKNNDGVWVGPPSLVQFKNIYIKELSGDLSAKGSPRPLRVLILSGGGNHDWRSNAAILRRILTDTARFDVRICESPAGLTSSTLADFDLLVDDYAGPSLGNTTEDAIAGFVESGKGLVITHGALTSSKGIQTSGGSKPPGQVIPRYWPAVSVGEPESPVRFLEVKIAKPEHPIVRGMKSGFRTADAVSRGMGTPAAAEVIATVLDDSHSGGSGKDVPVLITSNRGKGRVVGMALGHDAAAMHENEFVATFARASEWAASGLVTLPPYLGPMRPSDHAVKGLLITGGHDHEAAFYTIFDGYDDFGWIPVVASSAAFKADLRGKYDVVIMYDFSRDLDDNGKKNLRDFVEHGGGVVVLHHALLNYQNWTWWNDDVVGGSYRLTRAGSSPSSSVKNDQQIFVTPAREHQIIAGIGPFHINDEAYKNLRMSPKIRPLLTTDNPTSDTNLAWIGPNDQFRVVAIQSGHGHSAFGHPSYRALVHNAVLWAAGKTK